MRVVRGIVLTSAVGALSLAQAGVASPSRSSYCSPTGDYCTKVAMRDGHVVLDVGTFSFRAYTLCVTPPRGRGTCHRFRLRPREHGLYRSVVRWDRHFPDRGRGRYAVRWKVAGNRIGPVLSFRRPARRSVDAARQPLVLKADERGLVTLGDLRPLRNPRLRAAIRAFGEPTGKRGIGEEACNVRWSNIGLWIKFSNFGGADACTPANGYAQELVIKGRRAGRWRTDRGLRLGDSVAELRRRHPAATLHDNGWWLATRSLPYGEGCPCPDASLRAKVTRGRVSSFRAWLGFAGD